MTSSINETETLFHDSIDENILQDYEGPPFDPMVAVVLTAVTAGLAFCFFPAACCTYGCSQMDEGKKLRGALIIAGTALFLFSSACFFFCAIGLEQLEPQDYRGKMRVTGWEIVRTVKSGSEDFESDKSYFVAQLQVDWGYDWACPNHRAVNCSSTTVAVCRYKACNSGECKGVRDAKARNAARRCATQHYFDYEKEYTPYDPQVGPSHDDNWPSTVLYGDCDTCAARWDIAGVEEVKNLRLAGFVFLTASVLLLAAAVALHEPRTPRIPCPVCKVNFSSEQHWTKHMTYSKGKGHRRYRREHAGDWNRKAPVVKGNNEMNQDLHCPVCKVRFPSEQDWTKHMAYSKGKGHRRYRRKRTGDWNKTHESTTAQVKEGYKYGAQQINQEEIAQPDTDNYSSIQQVPENNKNSESLPFLL